MNTSRLPLLLGITMLIAVLDQWTKHWIMKSFEQGSGLEVIPGFFRIVHVRNKGIAFGVLSELRMEILPYLLAVTNLLALGVLCFALLRLTHAHRGIPIAFSLIAGGAIGNLIDRLRFKEVIDFLDFYIGKYHWPAFNLADTAISFGVLISCFILLKTPGKKEGDKAFP